MDAVTPAGVNNERASITTSWPVWRAVAGFAPCDKLGVRQSKVEERSVAHTDFVRMVFQ